MIKAEYANIVNVRKLQEEFILDFALKYGEKDDEAELVGRIVLSPAHTGRLGEMLTKLSTTSEAGKGPFPIWPRTYAP